MNDDLKVDQVSDRLAGKTIALGVTGGIAAIEAVKLTRALRREGAEVNIFATPTALKFVGKASLEWAATKPIVDELSGLAEHICTEDLVLVAPATINTVNAIGAGLADNAVTTLVCSALGQGTPVLIAPTGHGSLYNNPMFQHHLDQLPKMAPSISFIPPKEEEGKAKMPEIEALVEAVVARLGERGNGQTTIV